MSARKKTTIKACLITLSSFLPAITISAIHTPTTCQITTFANTSLARDTIAKHLGWVNNPAYFCGGYYLEEPFIYKNSVEKSQAIEITGEQGLLSQHGTSTLEGQVSITRGYQQITANKAYLYRDVSSGKLNAIEMVGNVHYREPNTLIIGRRGRYHLEKKTKSLIDILYRTSLTTGREIIGPVVTSQELRHERKITALTAWGSAYEFSQTIPRIYELSDASYTTCPPIQPAWQVKAKHIVLNKITGRGEATHARIVIKNIPVFYLPYINFPIDKQRKTGFLLPTIGTSNEWGPYLLAPFYWNMAPNYDMTITPGLLTARGLQLSDNFRYLTSTSEGNINVSVLPNDREFANFKNQSEEKYSHSHDPVIEADLSRLLKSSDTRKGFFWRDDSQFSHHWSSHIDFNYAGDDYYLRDFGSNLNEITQNQLLQEGDLYYKGPNVDFIGRLQTYQTLHPIVADNQIPVQNQYRRLPQLILNLDYPNQAYGFDYFVNSEVTHFETLKTPGTDLIKPVGNRFHMQPGISWPYYLPYFYVNPRLQIALTEYNLHQVEEANVPGNDKRAIPIFDIASGLNFNRSITLFRHGFQQTLEPQIYYTYIPYRNQADIPIFDTTVNTLTYDQVFNYNRFSGIDRIGDANQIGIGITTRLIDQESGFEKVRLGVGELIYFANRRVTLCNNDSCTDNPDNPNLERRLSPISGLLKYSVNPAWYFGANTLWNPITKLFENTTFNIHYQPDLQRIINLSYSFVRNGDSLSGITVNSSQSNLQVADLSFAWPVTHAISTVGRFSQDIRQNHFQNLLFGLQYDTCCWAMRLVGGRAFTALSTNNAPQYHNQYFLQIALKGLGNIGTGNPNGLLSTISGYHTQFGQEI